MRACRYAHPIAANRAPGLVDVPVRMRARPPRGDPAGWSWRPCGLHAGPRGAGQGTRPPHGELPGARLPVALVPAAPRPGHGPVAARPRGLARQGPPQV